MKRTQVSLWLAVIAIVLVSCDTTPTGLDDSASFEGGLKKQPIPVGEFDSSVPSGTVYRLGGDTTTYTASGGEILYDLTETENTNSYEYTAELYAGRSVVYGSAVSVTIANPSNMSYLNTSNIWVPIYSAGTYTAKGLSGSGTITTNVVGIWDDNKFGETD